MNRASLRLTVQWSKCNTKQGNAVIVLFLRITVRRFSQACIISVLHYVTVILLLIFSVCYSFHLFLIA